MYFRSYEKTELKGFYQTVQGEHLWPFVEVGFPLPLYLLQTETEVEGEIFRREIQAAHVTELIKFADGLYPEFRLLTVDLLFNSPSQNRRTFHKLHEIWASPQGGALRFIVDHGTALDLDPSGKGIDKSHVKLIFRTPTR